MRCPRWCCRRITRLAEKAKVALAELVNEPMILLDVNPSRENTEMMFSAAGLSPWIRFRTTDFEVTRSMVARGMGYAILVQRPVADVSYEGRPLAVRPDSSGHAQCAHLHGLERPCPLFTQCRGHVGTGP